MLKRVFAILLILSLLLPAYVLSEQQLKGQSPKGYSHDGSVPDSTLLEDAEYFNMLIQKLNESKSHILVSMYIFKTTGSKSNAANKVRDALTSAAKKGVNVKVLLEIEDERSSSLNEENRSTADSLVQGGVYVYFDSPHRRTHVKAIVIDDRYTFIGSHNLTASALQYNKELSLMIDSEEVAKKTAKYIEDMIAKNKHYPKSEIGTPGK